MLYDFLHSTYIDEIGFRFGFPRFESESLEHYRKRLFQHISDLPEATQKSFFSTLNRYIGDMDKQVFTIEPVLVHDAVKNIDTFLAPDLKIEIDSCFFRVWSDFKNKPDEPEVELDIWNRGTGYFLKDVYEAVEGLDFVTITANRKSWQYWKSSHLKCNSTSLYKVNHLLDGSKIHKLPNKNIDTITFTDKVAFKNEVYDYEDMNYSGDYFVDYIEGLAFSYVPGRGSCDYSYYDFPFKIHWQTARSFALNDKSVDHITKDWLINSENKEQRLLLNSYGAKIANEILQIHPLQWGK